MENKRKYAYKEMLGHMKDKGIHFNIASEADALDTLRHVNYYFKLTAYRKCFARKNGRYIDLDFAYLADLAAIDVRIREFCLKLALDIEHSIKVVILDLVANNPNEDGYTIVQDFKSSYPDVYSQLESYWQSSKYLKEMYAKHKDHLSVWTMLEVMPFGAITRFVDFYQARDGNNRLKDAADLLRYAKNLRNASAHNNPILVNIFSKSEKIRLPNQRVVWLATHSGLKRQDVTDMKINDLVCLIHLHKVYCSKDMNSHMFREGKRIIDRMKRHSEWYSNNLVLQRGYQIFDKLVVDLNS